LYNKENQLVFEKQEGEKHMANKKFCLGILALALVFGIMVVGCKEPSTENEQRTLVVQNMPKSEFEYAAVDNESFIAIFPVGAEMGPENRVAAQTFKYRTLGGPDTGPYTVSFQLNWTDDDINYHPWTGNGIFDVIIVFKKNDTDMKALTTKRVQITSKITTIPWSSFKPL
jgi:hypothetical protein